MSTNNSNNVPILVNINWNIPLSEIRLNIYNQLRFLPVIVKVFLPLGGEEFEEETCYIGTPAKLIEFLVGIPLFGKICASIFPECPPPRLTILYRNEESGDENVFS